MRTNSSRSRARAMLNWLRRLIPTSSPLSTERVAREVVAIINTIWAISVAGISNR